MPYLKRKNGILILSGDVPLLSFGTINGLIEQQATSNTELVIATADLAEPGSLGRIKRDEDGELVSIVEAADASEEDMAIREVNVGVYCVGSEHRFLDVLDEVKPDNVQGEYYLTDAVRLFLEQGNAVGLYMIDEPTEALGINTVDDLARAEACLREAERQHGGRSLGAENLISQAST